MPGQSQASPARSQPARRPRREADRQGGPGEARRRDLTRPLPDPVAIRLSRVPDTAPPYDDEAPGEPESGPARAGALAAAIVAALEVGNHPPRAVQASAEGPGAARRPGWPASSVPPARPLGRGGRASTARQADTPSQAGSTRKAGTGGGNRTPSQAGVTRKAAIPSQASITRKAGTPRQAGITRPSPEPHGWPSRFAQVLAETLAGSRPPAQIAPWTTERARSHIRRLGPLLTSGQQPLVHRVITSAPTAGVVEMSVVVGFGPRVRALAVRLERTQPRPATAGHPARPSRWLCTAVEAA